MSDGWALMGQCHCTHGFCKAAALVDLLEDMPACGTHARQYLLLAHPVAGQGSASVPTRS